MHRPESKVGALSFGRRAGHLERLGGEEFDLLVIGGGITGGGIALDAASRGLRVGLLEKGDFAVGTSSRSTKLVHGGLRYLAQFEFALTHEALTERYILQELAPSLIHWAPFVLPVHGNVLEMGKLFVGLWLYDLLASMRAPTLHRRLGRQEVLKMAPGLREEGLLGGFVYSDCRTDDVRLTLEVLRTAVGRGAAIANYAEVLGFAKERGRAVGVEAVDRRSGEAFRVRARQTVVAVGVWLDQVLRLDDPSARRRIRPAKGVHLVVPRSRLGFDVALFLPTAPDGRLVFVIPWQGATLIGTTDTDYSGGLEAPLATSEDVAYLLESVNRAFPDARLQPADVCSLQAGLRPLIDGGEGATTKVSREDRIYETESGLIAVAGGKLTTYRRMAQRVVDLAIRRLREAGHSVPESQCLTDRIPLGAFAPGPIRPAPELKALPAEVQAHLEETYGANAGVIAGLVGDRPELGERLVPGLPNLKAEVVYAARHEMAETIADALARRAHVVQLDPDQGRSGVRVAAELMAQELGWDEAKLATEVARFEEDVRQFSPRAVSSSGRSK